MLKNTVDLLNITCILADPVRIAGSFFKFLKILYAMKGYKNRLPSLTPENVSNKK